jgi:cytochrome c2
MEQRSRKDTANKAATVYQDTIGGNVSPTDSVVLHHAHIDEIPKWTKEHLDAYLASPATVIIDQLDEPG